MVSGLVDRITAVLREHQIGFQRCSCGWFTERGVVWDSVSAHLAERVAEAVKPDVERLARALWNAEQPYWTEGKPFGRVVPWRWDDATEGQRDIRRQMARKVIAELDQEET